MSKESKTILAITVVFILIAAFLGYLGVKMQNSNGVEADSGARAVVQNTFFDWEDIGINDGNVSASFSITNEGTSELVLYNVETSCMCTTAQLVSGNSESPLFGMHSNSKYKMELPAGETVQLIVEFDPAYHGPSGVGPVSRQVKVSTNDPDNPELIFLLKANVTGK
jgi:hypothetical protein